MGWGQGRFAWGTFGSDIPQFGVTDVEVLESVLLSLLETGFGQWIPSEPGAFNFNPVLNSVYGKTLGPSPGFKGECASMLNFNPGPDQFAEATVVSLGTPGLSTGNFSVSVCARMSIDPSTGLISCYFLNFSYDGQFALSWEVGIQPNKFFGAGTDFQRNDLVPRNTHPPPRVGDVIRIEAIGSSIVGKLNGIVVFGPVTDTRLVGGQPGLEAYPEDMIFADALQLSNFRCGALPSGAIQTPPLATVGTVTGQLSSMWSRDQIIQYLNDRQRRFINESGITAAVMYQAGQADQPRYQLPGNLVDIRRVAWANSADPMAYTELPRADAWELDHGRSNWPTANAQSPEVYMEDHLPSLTIAVEPTPTDAGEMEIVAITQGTQVDGSGILLSVPDDFTPYLAWGVRADMLAGEFEGNDPVRAAHCEARFTEGIELARILVSGDGGQ